MLPLTGCRRSRRPDREDVVDNADRQQPGAQPGRELVGVIDGWRMRHLGLVGLTA
jgi:hypothetical protein